MALTAAGRAGHETHREVQHESLILPVAAALMMVAVVIHVLVSPAHLREWLPAGVFFLVVATGQAALAVSLLRRAAPIAILASIWSSVGLVCVYVWSRTAGLPFAPLHDAGEHGAGESQLGHAVGGHGNGVPAYPGVPTPSSAEPA